MNREEIFQEIAKLHDEMVRLSMPPNDPEINHCRGDDILCDVIKILRDDINDIHVTELLTGIVKTFDQIQKWYA